MSPVRIVADITILKWLGDSPSLISTLKFDWEHIVDDLDPKVGLEGSVLQELLA